MNHTRFTFIRDDRGQPVGCIAYRVNGGKFEYEVSTHNPKDEFDRKLARKVAEGRLDKHPMLISFDPLIPPSLPQLLRSAAFDLVSEPALLPEGRVIPGRLVRALEAHLKQEENVSNEETKHS